MEQFFYTSLAADSELANRPSLYLRLRHASFTFLQSPLLLLQMKANCSETSGDSES